MLFPSQAETLLRVRDTVARRKGWQSLLRPDPATSLLAQLLPVGRRKEKRLILNLHLLIPQIFPMTRMTGSALSHGDTVESGTASALLEIAV